MHTVHARWYTRLVRWQGGLAVCVMRAYRDRRSSFKGLVGAAKTVEGWKRDGRDAAAGSTASTALLYIYVARVVPGNGAHNPAANTHIA